MTVLTSAGPASTSFSCDAVHFGFVPQTHTAIHADRSHGAAVFEFLDVERDRCTQAVIIGDVTFSPAEDDIASMAEAAHAYFRERTPAADRGIVIRGGAGGTLERTYRVDGAVAPYDTAARRWLGGLLPTILREAAVNVGPRVARWRAEGGVSHALAMIGAMKSPTAMKSHYDVLIDSGRLSSEDADRVMQQASRDLRGSSDLHGVLSKLTLLVHQ